MFRLEHKLASVPRVGSALAKMLARHDMVTVEDLLWFVPLRYEDYQAGMKIRDIQPETLVTLRVRVDMIAAKRTKHKRMQMTEALVSDGEDVLKVVWFNQPYIAHQLKVGDDIVISGKVTQSTYGLQLNNPEYSKQVSSAVARDGMVPVYSALGTLSQKQIRQLISQVLDATSQVHDDLPAWVREDHQLMGLGDALRAVHAPADEQELQAAIRRMSFDELFGYMLQAALFKQGMQQHHAQPQPFQQEAIQTLVKELPFPLTDDQRAAAWKIFQDMEREVPMNRLLEGDVGSGKTVVALMALYHTVRSGQQGVLLVPTTLLATQQYEVARTMLATYGVRLGLLTQSHRMRDEKVVTKEHLLNDLQSGDCDVVIGTHALFGEHVYFHNCGLVVIDEQHRFGVEQRKLLKERNLAHTMPHLLSMTATPIPRSLALVVYGDLDVSLLRHKPQGRKPIITKVIGEGERAAAYQAIRRQIEQGRQAFVICPLIDESDKLGVTSVKQEYARLHNEIFPDMRIGMLHGKLKPREKDAVLEAFARHELDLLVATSVIEVGMDIPNASVMMIEGAQRFGLAQLHQLRGRVGRAEHQSYCYIFHEDGASIQTQQRLRALEKTEDGFALAEYDLQMRGPGEIYGTRQSGLPPLRYARLDDLALMQEVRDAVANFLERDSIERYPQLTARLAAQQIVNHRE